MFMRSQNACDFAKSAQDRLQRQFLKHVSCDCRGGILYLRGRTHSYYEKQLAQESVRRLDGIQTVINEIEVES